MKKIILSITSIIFVGAILIAGTNATFNDKNTSSGNTFATGVIDLKVDNESYVTNDDGVLVFSPSTSWSLSSLQGKLFFNFLDLKPGDIGEDTISLHVSNNKAWACMKIKITATPENGRNEPELLVDTTGNTNSGELQNYLYFVFWADDGDNVIEKEIPENLKEEAAKYRAELVERIVENDEQAMDKYLAGEEIPLSDLKKILRKAVIENKIFPVFCGSALKNKGATAAIGGRRD
jgi:predicted ribosomally synthesized peptide with SipW-like signal peptide